MQSPLSNCRTFLLLQKSAMPINSHSLFPLPPKFQPPTTTNILRIYGFAYSGHFIQIESYNTWLLVSKFSTLNFKGPPTL